MKKSFLMLVVLLFAILTGCSTTETPTPKPVVKTPLELLRAKQWSYISATLNSTNVEIGSPLYRGLPLKLTFNVDNTYRSETSTGVFTGRYAFSDNSITFPGTTNPSFTVLKLNETDLQISVLVVGTGAVITTNIITINYK